MGEPGVGRMRDRLLLYSGIYRNPFEIFGVDRPGAVGHREALLQQRGDLLLTQPLAPARQRRAIKWQLVPEHHLPTEVLEIRVLHPSLAQRLVGEVVHMLENEQPGYQPGRQRRLPRSQPTERAESSRQTVPIDRPRQPHQRMAKVDDLLEKRAKQVFLAIVARLAHRSPPTANLAVEGITDHPNRESQTAIKPACTPAFLQNRFLAQVKSSRAINRFLILHGRPSKDEIRARYARAQRTCASVLHKGRSRQICRSPAWRGLCGVP